ncbi:MAG: hypothetical protein A2252_04925 [Elusimicrobia bacterium RIFOXYA2_FULL_39_19]|nr:MAG: hypothetical protein A2252_04925 [Elusimicrobia bacterium RIFOXYA2_FULL_39_19]
MISKITAYPPDGVTSISYYHYDGIGSASAITDANGTVTNTYRYDPFGNMITSTGKLGRYSFVGAFGVENDGMSGLFHMGARYYDPTTGRFIQRDPIRGFVSDPLSLNRYIYCGNNPMNFIDPKGLTATAGTTDPETGETVITNTEAEDQEGNRPKAIFNGYSFIFFYPIANGYIAVSGNGTHQGIPSGTWDATNLRTRTKTGMVDLTGLGWSVDLKPNFSTDRDLIRIHPDQPPYGTEGCIGIEGDTRYLYNAIQGYLSLQTSFTVQVTNGKCK